MSWPSKGQRAQGASQGGRGGASVSAEGLGDRRTCSIEASPRSVNYWVMSRGPHEPGSMHDESPLGDSMQWVKCSILPLDRAVNPGRRFTPSEQQESLYTTLVSLTIKAVRRSDLGNYTCNARNSLGSVKETIALKGTILTYSYTTIGSQINSHQAVQC